MIATRVCIVHFIGHLKMSPEVLQSGLQSELPLILGQPPPKLNLNLLSNFQLTQLPFGAAEAKSPLFHYNKFCVNVGILLILYIPFSETDSFREVLASHMTTIENFKQAPTFIFIHIPISKHIEEQNDLSKMFALNWLEFSTTAEIFVYDESSVFKINLGCGGHEQLPTQCQVLSRCNSVSFGNPNIYCFKTQDNFNKYVFNLKDIFGMNIFSPAEGDCSLAMSPLYLRNSPQECTIAAFHTLLNLSSINSGRISLTATEVSFCYTALTRQVSDLLKFGSWKLKFINYGFSLESFEFIMMTQLLSASPQAFVYPFSISVWISMAISSLLFFGYLSVVQEFKQLPFTFFWILATFTMQINSTFTSKIRKDFGSFQGYVIVLWILFIFVLGFLYQGSLLSFLIMKSAPKVPQTLREATKLKFPLITTEKSIFGSFQISTLQNLAQILIVTANSNHDTQLVEFLSNLMATSVFLSNQTSILKTISNFTQFGLIDPPEGLKRMRKLVTLLNPDLVAVKNYDINPFASSSTWLMQPNIFYKKFSMTIGSLVSSGLYNTWNLNCKIAQQFSALRNANVNSTGDKSKGALTVISEGRIFNWANGEDNFSESGLRQDILTEAQSVTMKVMIYPLIVFSLFSLSGILVFCLERIVNCCQRNPVQNLNC